MITVAYYFLQVIICSAIMMGYYWLMLRNKRFHQYNRFYLLAVALLSWIIPLIKIQWTNSAPITSSQMFYLLNVVADNNRDWEQVVHNTGFHWSRDMILTSLYVIVSGFLLVVTLKALFRIRTLLKTHSCRSVDDVFLILTRAKDTPFSFFRYIFWNEEIDIRSESGKQILKHELTHVRQKHSVDKMFLQLVLIVGWFNPFFWLLKREMELIHEFIADMKAVDEGDTAALAQMLLTVAYPQQRFLLTNPFFYSPIKRRLQMLRNNNTPRFSYLRRLVVLPLFGVVLVLFAFRSAAQQETLSMGTVMETVVNGFRNTSEGKHEVANFNVKLSRTYRVVVHAGHGGVDKGVTGIDGTTEAQLNLAISRMIKKVNTNNQIDVVLVRDADELITVEQVVNIVKDLNPDLFLSVHMNGTAPNVKQQPSGAEIYISSKEKAIDYAGNHAFASAVANQLKIAGTNFLGIKSRGNGVYVLQNLACPSILVETGYLTNKQDLVKLKDPVFQRQMAVSMLQGAVDYLILKDNGITTNEKGSPKLTTGVEGVAFASVQEVFERMAEKSTIGTSNTVVAVDTVPASELHQKRIVVKGASSSTIETPLIILDGKKISEDQMSKFDPNDIAAVQVFKNDSAVALYGEKGKNGVILVTTKTGEYKGIQRGEPNNVFAETTELAAFKKKHPSIESVNWSSSPLRINITLKDGTKESYNLENSSSKAKAVEKYGKLPTPPPPPKAQAQIEQLQSGVKFKGGDKAWHLFQAQHIDKALLKYQKDPGKVYTVPVSFVLDEHGRISNVRPLSSPGYKLADAAVNLVKRSVGQWIPASFKGAMVKADHMVKVIFKAS